MGIASISKTAVAAWVGLGVGAVTLGGIAGAAPASSGAEKDVVITNTAAAPVPVNGSVAVANLPATQQVSGTVAIGNFPATQQVGGTVNIGNLPAKQEVQGSVSINNLPATQQVAGTVQVANGATPLAVKNVGESTETVTFWLYAYAGSGKKWGKSGADQNYTVPAGKRLVIENVSYTGWGPANSQVRSFLDTEFNNKDFIYVADLHDSFEPSPGYRGWAGGETIKAYVPAGGKVSAVIDRSTDQSESQIAWVVNGHLENA